MTDTMKMAETVVRNTLIAVPDMHQKRIEDVIAVLKGEKVAVEPNVCNLPPMEPPIKPRDAAKLLGVTTKALEYHARCGRLHTVKPFGSSRCIGYVAADIRAMLEGKKTSPLAA